MEEKEVLLTQEGYEKLEKELEYLVTEMVYDLVWNEPYSGDYNVVMRHICNIREKIEDDPGQPLYIQTVRGVGYRFNGNLGSK